MSSFDKALDRVARRAGWGSGEVRSRIFRQTYITTRLQTLDRGAPVALWTVAQEVGHTSTTLIEKVYGRLGSVRHRAEMVEYLVAQHRAKVEDRFGAVVTELLAPLEGDPSREYR